MVFLVFCSAIYSTYTNSPVCIAPTKMPSISACEFVARKMVDAAQDARGYRNGDARSQASYRCLTIGNVTP